MTDLSVMRTITALAVHVNVTTSRVSTVADDRRTHAAIRITVDLVIFTVRQESLQVLLVERGNPPYRGRLALPGGFMRANEDLDGAARRELLEETGLGGSDLPHLEQLGAYSAPDRDPRGRVVTVSYLALAPDLPVPLAGSDAVAAVWEPVEPLLSRGDRLAFDHDIILRNALEHARRMLENTTLATAFCDRDFTMGDLKRVYEAVWGVPLDLRNFYRKVNRTEGFVVPTGEKRALETGRPALLYRKGPATLLYPPMMRVTHSDAESSTQTGGRSSK
jgi:8-oxo-dGTP diphosphatase